LKNLQELATVLKAVLGIRVDSLDCQGGAF